MLLRTDTQPSTSGRPSPSRVKRVSVQAAFPCSVNFPSNAIRQHQQKISAITSQIPVKTVRSISLLSRTALEFRKAPLNLWFFPAFGLTQALHSRLKSKSTSIVKNMLELRLLSATRLLGKGWDIDSMRQILSGVSDKKKLSSREKIATEIAFCFNLNQATVTTAADTSSVSSTISP